MKKTLLTAALLAGAVAHAATPYTATEFSVPGATSAFLYDINNTGSMVGFATVAGSSASFVHSGGVFTWLAGPAGSLNTTALGLSDGGIVVGAYSDSLVDDGEGNMVLGPNKGFIFEAGSYTTLALDGFDETVIRAVSPGGRFLTGYARTGNEFTGWALDRDTNSLSLIASGVLVIAQGVTDAGLVVGSRAYQPVVPGPLVREAFSWQAGSYTGFNLTGQTDTRARAITDDGQMAGWLRSGADIRAFFGTQADYTTVQWGAFQTYAEGINNAGMAVGGYYVDDTSGNSMALIFNPVPEPSTYALMLGGLGLLGAAARRRRT